MGLMSYHELMGLAATSPPRRRRRRHRGLRGDGDPSDGQMYDPASAGLPAQVNMQPDTPSPTPDDSSSPTVAELNNIQAQIDASRTSGGTPGVSFTVGADGKTAIDSATGQAYPMKAYAPDLVGQSIPVSSVDFSARASAASYGGQPGFATGYTPGRTSIPGGGLTPPVSSTSQDAAIRAQYAQAAAAHQANVAAGLTTTSYGGGGLTPPSTGSPVYSGGGGGGLTPPPPQLQVRQGPGGAPTAPNVQAQMAAGYVPGSISSAVALQNLQQLMQRPGGGVDPLSLLQARQQPKPKSTGIPTIAWVGIGGAAVALILGGIFVSRPRPVSYQNPRRKRRKKKNRRQVHAWA